MLSRLLRSVPAVWVGWVVARLLSVWFIKLEDNPLGDVYYYHFGIYGDDPSAMTEYPWLGQLPSALLARLVGPDFHVYWVAFPIMILVLDASFMALVLRRHPETKSAIDAAWLWVFFGTAAGQVFLLRLDLFPALVVAAAGYFLFKHPALSGAMVAIATAMKLWPGVLAAGIVGRASHGRTWSALAAFVGTGAAVIAATIAFAGVDRLTSPLDYQEVRGLQIESVAATPFVYRNFFNLGTWKLAYAPSKSFEITGPGVETATQIATFAMAAVILFGLGWALYRFIRGGWTPESTLAFFVLMVLLLIVTNKVFSTQYITWLGPLLVVAVARGGWPTAQRALLWTLAVFAVVCAGLGTFVYPFNYEAIYSPDGTQFLPIAALALRNVLVVLMALVAAVWFVLACRHPRSGAASVTPAAGTPSVASTATTPSDMSAVAVPLSTSTAGADPQLGQRAESQPHSTSSSEM